MASCLRRKSEADAGRDLISELPSELKERILECLPTRYAARTAVLSTHWYDVWMRHGRLVFDKDFLQCLSKYEGDKGIALISIINGILMLRAGPVKKFTLRAHFHDPKPRQSDLDRWCRFLWRNGIQELNLRISGEGKYKLPSCVFSCRTIKKLILGYFIFDVPITGISPSLTSLAFHRVEFSDNFKGIRYSIPNLEELSFRFCEGITNFEISSPKLERYTVFDSLFWSLVDESRWFMHYFKTIKTLCLSANVFPCKNTEIAAMTFPTAINLQVIELYEFNFSCGVELAFVLQLLQNSPNLCLLNIVAECYGCSCDIETVTSLLEDPNSCIIKKDLKILNAIVIEDICGCTKEMLFVKMLLSKSPALERFYILELEQPFHFNYADRLREWLRLPHASPKAQIVYRQHDGSLYELFENIWLKHCRNLV